MPKAGAKSIAARPMRARINLNTGRTGGPHCSPAARVARDVRRDPRLAPRARHLGERPPARRRRPKERDPRGADRARACGGASSRRYVLCGAKQATHLKSITRRPPGAGLRMGRRCAREGFLRRPVAPVLLFAPALGRGINAGGRFSPALFSAASRGKGARAKRRLCGMPAN